ncbi:MAG: TRAP transporter small permease [Betaproteobacteria bacterium]|nr:TRAP transporter small permease [Betaproteobacteria bacterium]MBA3775691.1 TRAP transporter small permease [Betaproteobacteria bacterium]
MRTALNRLYRASGVLAGFFLVCIAAMTFAQIIGRLLGIAARSFDDFAGFSMAASFFLGLAWTMRCGEHIRVSLVLQHVQGGARRALEILCLAVSLFLCGYFAYYTIDMTVTSYQLNDVSQGLVAVPLWIPQLGMALGLVVLTIALADDLLVSLSGGIPSYEVAEATKASAMPSFER